jgi:putative transcriptional regulator
MAALRSLLNRSFAWLLAAALLGALLVHSTPAAAAEPIGAVILVAKRQLTDPFYRHTVLLARPIGGDQHIGFILNRPSKLTLGELFPEHAPSRRVADPVFVGGPTNASVIFALVRSHASPGGKSFRMMPDVFMAFEGDTVDHIIETDPSHARFVAGLVSWRPGELRAEIRRGAWYVLHADPALILRKPTDGLWEELLRRAKVAADAI